MINKKIFFSLLLLAAGFLSAAAQKSPQDMDRFIDALMKKMTVEEKVEVKRQIEVFKQYYDLISDGDYFRLTSPQDNNCVVWEMAAKDASEALISAVYQHVQTNCAAKFVYPRGLCSEASYEVSLTDLKGDKKDRLQKQVLTGAALMRGGLRLPGADSDYAAWQISLKKL